MAVMSDVDVSEENIDVVRESVLREKQVVKRKAEMYEERVKDFEDKHGMTSEKFLEKFESGELGDDKEWFEWKADFQALQHLKDRLEKLENTRIE